MATTVKLKRSSVSGKVPAVSDLSLGELALNTFDGKLYTKKDNGTASIVEIGGAGGGGGGISGVTVGTFATGTTTDVGSAVTAIRFDSASGFSVVAGPNGATEARISMNSTFKTWHVAGQTDLVAVGEDEVTFEGNGVTITTSAVNGVKKLTFRGQIFSYSATSPQSPVAGDEWVDSDTGIMYKYIDDGTSSQWAEFGPVTGTGGGAGTVDPIETMLFC